MILNPLERWKSRLTDSTWNVYQKWWHIFEDFVKEKHNIENATDVINLSIQDASDVAADFYNFLQGKGYSINSCACAYCAIRSFFSYNGCRLEKSSGKFRGGISELETRKKLTQREVADLMHAIPNVRDKAAVGICFQGGQRIGIACSLKLKYIVTRDWENASVVVFDIPRLVLDMNGKNVNKRNVNYMFGILDDVAQLIKMHLREREMAGEKLTPESWLFRSRSIPPKIRVTYSHPTVVPIKGAYLNGVVTHAATKIGIQSVMNGRRKMNRYAVHAHVGRSYFKTQTRLANIDAELRNYMLGHKLPYGEAYDRFNEQEITGALEKARGYLLMVPDSYDNVVKRRQGILEWAKVQVQLGELKSERYAELERLILQTTNTSEITEIFEELCKNGKVVLEPIGR